MDVSLLRPAGSQYAMMLNAQGRVLYDLIVYRPAHGRGGSGAESTPATEGEEHLLECDANVTEDLVRLLKRYALRSKVSISAVESELNVWAMFPGLPTEAMDDKDNDTGIVISTSDPRVGSFGTRVITKGMVDPRDVWSGLKEAAVDCYNRHRLQTGIAEGVGEIPPGGCFPLEYNLDYLNGVSFNKGCYIGQELTARTHHTGVVRKRVLPVTLESPPTEVIPTGTAIKSSVTGKAAGKLVCHHGDLGLALLRLQDAVKGGLIVMAGEEVGLTTHKPSWWPE